jgi:hypothetical protein
MELDFKGFLEGSAAGLNAPGRAGQHFWKPETPMLRDNTPQSVNPQMDKKKPLKGTSLNAGFRPLPPAPFKGLTADKFGIKKVRVPKPYI